VARSAGTHLNIFDLYDDAPDDLFPRGFPYSARIGYCRAEIGPPCDCNVGFCLGLWRNVFDVNAVDKINGPAHVHPEIGLRHGSVAIAPGNLISVCSMNMQFRRETLPAVIQLPMNVEVMSGWVIDRYGDIWGGFIQKSLMDLRGDALAVGEPMIRHAREGDYLRNIWQEHIPHLLNDEFLGLLAEAMEGVRPGDYLEMVGSLADQFERVSGRGTALFRPYARHLLRTLRAWRQALSREGA
jgi:hypothetical protein